MAKNNITINGDRIIKEFKFTIEVKTKKTTDFRIWLSMRLLNLAGFVAPYGVEIIKKEA